jgi:flagellar basal-body rod protein FlgB
MGTLPLVWRPGLLESLFGNTEILQKSLSGLTTRQRALAENVANADTPGYKRVEVSYEKQLSDAVDGLASGGDELPLKTDDARQFTLGPLSLGALKPEIRTIEDESYRNDGNNVDIEEQMSNMAETNIRYNTMASLTQHNFDRVKNLLKEIN